VIGWNRLDPQHVLIYTPCRHWFRLLRRHPKNHAQWFDISTDETTTEIFDGIRIHWDATGKFRFEDIKPSEEAND